PAGEDRRRAVGSRRGLPPGPGRPHRPAGDPAVPVTGPGPAGGQALTVTASSPGVGRCDQVISGRASVKRAVIFPSGVTTSVPPWKSAVTGNTTGLGLSATWPGTSTVAGAPG